MFSGTLLAAAVALAAITVTASPTLHTRQGVSPLSTAQINAYTLPFAYYASAGYCDPSTTSTWSCGINCANTSDFVPTATGGNGDDIQFWFVGYSPSLSSVIVSHQGTDPSSIESLLVDGDLVRGELDSSLFPGISDDVHVHKGFRDAHAAVAKDVLAAVLSTLQDIGVSDVVLVGHSLGAALSLLDAAYLPLHLPNANFRYIGFALPRVGNQEWADYLDSNVKGDLVHITNKDDLVPILPGRGLGYHHPSGEVHITDANVWNSCPGQDSTADGCTIEDVPNIFAGDLDDHRGPYNGVTISSSTCST
ncbi:lipase [Cylindrobasidium torrendii FP15055 ss-10]|uniref:Lipase n=1 Tax=Cylindrobasidium torrendii FP15055 ss-10 TaxID=1314674 RepID=A0A0D7AZK3_9AGAR|nr:lipase [Cylindrobasidium torrendii FP15055 ss-10]